MIALDTSALVAVALDEDDGLLFGQLLKSRKCIVGAPTLLETFMVLSGKTGFQPDVFWRDIDRLSNISTIPFDSRCLAAARMAFDRFGRGRNPRSALNYGDCMAYAVAKVHGAPLLFKGQDFLATDIEPAIRT
jgi:ribonuclease VapC